MATELPRRLEDAGQLKALGLVLEILEMEAEAREQRKIARRRHAAQLPPGNTWETLDHNVLPAALMRKLRDLAQPSGARGETRWLSVCSESARATPPPQSQTRLSSRGAHCCFAQLTSWSRSYSPPSAT